MTDALAPYITLKRAESAYGWSVKAMEHRIDRGIWIEGIHWMRSHGSRYLIVKGVNQWLEAGQASPSARAARSA